MNDKDTTVQLLLAIVAVNILVLLVLIYWINPVDLPGPGDDIAVTAGAFWLANKTGILDKVSMLIEALTEGGDDDTK